MKRIMKWSLRQGEKKQEDLERFKIYKKQREEEGEIVEIISETDKLITFEIK